MVTTRPSQALASGVESGALPRRLKIAIASTGRFHVLDLARELQALGHEVWFYSHVPPKRAEQFGLPLEAVVPLTNVAAPYLAWQRYGPQFAPTLRKQLYFRALNRAVTRRLKFCDVFIAMSGVYLEAAAHARAAFGAKIFLERGSMHVDAQWALLKSVRTLGRTAEYTRQRELAGYAMADRIVVPSSHAADSFARDNTLLNKVVVTPYGVDLDMFPLRSATEPSPRRVLYVGNWTYQKGVDHLVAAIDRLKDVELVHVGSLGDAPFPKRAGFIHHDPVDQNALRSYYQAGGVFVLASRQDGFGMVLLQALASGLSCVASEYTGGPTIHSVWPQLADRVRLFPVGDVDKLAAAIGEQLEIKAAPLDPEHRYAISWAEYGMRYEREILKALDE